MILTSIKVMVQNKIMVILRGLLSIIRVLMRMQAAGDWRGHASMIVF